MGVGSKVAEVAGDADERELIPQYLCRRKVERKLELGGGEGQGINE